MLAKLLNTCALISVCSVLVFSCQADDSGTGGTRENNKEKDGGSGTLDLDTDTDSDMDSDSDSDTDSSQDGAGCSKMDILFVIDDSGSMTEEQDNLILNFPRFIEVLEDYRTPIDTQVEYRVGVTTTGVDRKYKEQLPIFNIPVPASSSGPDGVLQAPVSCGLSEPWIDGPGADMAQKFSCIASVGATGSGTEMPFAALVNALEEHSKPGGPNDGFYRKDEDSLLVVVIITDEDDCSVEEGGTIVMNLADVSDCNEEKSIGIYEVEAMKEFLDDLAGGEGRYVVAAIAGPGPKSCDSDFGSAIYAKRVKRFVEICGDYGIFGNICEGDLSTCLREALDTMTLACDDFPPLE